MTAVFIAVFLVSAVALGLEVVLVRALSIGHWHHFSYLVISTALLGFGAGGTLIALSRSFFVSQYKKVIWWSAILLGIAVPLAFLLSQKIPFDQWQLLWDRRQIFYLLAYYLLFLVPFFFAGAVISLAFAVYSDRAGHVYFYNMAGSGLGAAAVVALMYGNSPERLLVLLSCVAFLAALVQSLSLSRRYSAASILCAVICVLLFGRSGPLELRINISEHKSLIGYRELPNARVSGPWYSPLARLDCVQSPVIRNFPGLSMAYEGSLPQQMLILTDADGGTPVNNFERLEDLRCYDYVTPALGYHLVDEPAVCVIGAGGGSDVAQAFLSGPCSVTAVEMNRRIVDLVQNRYNDFAGGLYRRDDVEIVIAEGRNFLESCERKFDIVSISMTGSPGASAGGIGAFSESHLYTVEAIQKALSVLAPGGVLSITRAIKMPPRDSLKMFATILEALKSCPSKVKNPGRHIIMIRSWATVTILASLEPFSEQQIETTRSFTRERSFDLVYLPGIKDRDVNRFHQLDQGAIYYEAVGKILSKESNDFYKDYPYNIRPAHDDRPYFFDFFKWKALPNIVRTMGASGLRFSQWGYLVLVATLAQAVIVGGILILVPLLFSKSIRQIRSGKFAVVSYFLLLGVAYMFLEMGFIQKMNLLIGHPVFAVAVTLSGFLLFSGLGALLSQRLLYALFQSQTKTNKGVLVVVLIIIVIGIAESIVLNLGFDFLVGLSRITRILFALLIIAPLAFFMGIPFPTVLRQLHTDRKPLIPWACGVNGFASVTAAVLGTLLAISIGFTAVVITALSCYLLAALISNRIQTKL
jgi:spermidine synthase